MKTQEEIEQLAEEKYKNNLHNPYFRAMFMGFIDGYKQCQEDMVDKKYTKKDMEKCFIAGGKLARSIDNPGFEDFINSLNKQD